MRNILLLIIFNIANVYSAGIEIIPDSQNVVIDEIFGITMKIDTQSGDEPQIFLDGNGIDVLEKENQGVSSTTTYINGKLSSKREYIIRYQLRANRTGRVSLVNIKAVSGSETLRHDNVYFSSANEPQNNRNIFVKADPSKTTIYKGEGILLRYSLYNKINIATYNINKFPVLSNFMKRFLQESPRPEKVNFNGEMYERRILYSMVIYPDKLGKVKIDPLVAEVSFPTRDSNSPFNSLGLGIRNYSKKTFSSLTVPVNVLPLPDGAPPGFTGLIGLHEFSLNVARDKYLVNEPVEIKLRVKGQGNLEDYESPELIKKEEFETFENSANLETTNSLLSTKTFNLTYLPRSEVTLESETIPFAVFDPDTKQYVSKNVERPKIIVLGGAITGSGSFQPKNNSKTEKQKEILMIKKLVSPVFNLESALSIGKIHRYINFSLFSIILLIVAIGLKGSLSLIPRDEYTAQLKLLKKSDCNYKVLYDFLDQLISQNISVYKKVENSELTTHAKEYFKNLLNNKESILYGTENREMKYSFKEKYFREALGVIKKNKSHGDV